MPTKQNPKKAIGYSMSKPKNSERSIANHSIIAFFVFLLCIFLPGLTGMDMFQYGFGLGFISMFIALTCLIVFLFYNARANSLDKITSGNALAHWSYPPHEWALHARKEYEIQKEEKRNLWLLISGITLIVGIFFGLTTKDAWQFTIIFVLSLILFLYLVSVLMPSLKYRNDLRHPPETFISKTGVYLTGEFHNWGMLSSRLEEAQFDASRKLIIIRYSYLVRYGRSEYTVRIPVPKGREKQAKQVAATLGKQIK